MFISVAYSTDDVVYEWRFGADTSVEIADDMRLSQFDLLHTRSYNGTAMFKGGKTTITQTCLCNTQRFLKMVKMIIFR